MVSLINNKIGVVGLGYVGLPLATAFAKKFPVVGFDINPQRVAALLSSYDATGEIDSEELSEVLVSVNFHLLAENGLYPTNNPRDLADCDIYIITVPTPIDVNNNPDLEPLKSASRLISEFLTEGNIVIYESTVYPGVTEEVCVPILERFSDLVYNEDFFVGYSPERINPGDKSHTVTKIKKVTSGSTPATASLVDGLYATVIEAGTYKASCIRVAEAAKVIENAQRDINIAFVNELSKIFSLMGIDTYEVLEAAGTKWNFLPFKPGLVGGHCIGVDPYYLAQKAQSLGYHPEIILAGRRINDSMGEHVASQVVKQMIQKDLVWKGSPVLILGFTFKENCPDIRNTRVIDIYKELRGFGFNVEVFDPIADPEEVMKEYNLRIEDSEVLNHLKTFSAIVLAVAHEQFLSLSLRSMPTQVVFDVKGILPVSMVDARL
ncbi:MAG: nucleotide sugar dehydrogenase [Cyclobacteriaceae bacterium]|nr:nucleotide sugar dehydrogenase [Cyclobacteriaceae bacterium]